MPWHIPACGKGVGNCVRGGWGGREKWGERQGGRGYKVSGGNKNDGVKGILSGLLICVEGMHANLNLWRSSLNEAHALLIHVCLHEIVGQNHTQPDASHIVHRITIHQITQATTSWEVSSCSIHQKNPKAASKAKTCIVLKTAKQA